jgi:flavorubredoxin
MGAVDWDRRMFDALIPIPQGTSYNAWLVQGSDKVALLDTVDDAMVDILLAQLADVPRLDYVVAHHAEQDHSGALPRVLERYPEARVICTQRAAGFLQDLLPIAPERFQPVADNETIDLGGKTLRFLHMPWVHWPETMVTWVAEDRILFSCDFFGSHLASADLFVSRESLLGPSKLYYAGIMMPFKAQILKHIERLSSLDIEWICPSHGPIHDRPNDIRESWRGWAGDAPSRRVVIPYVSMHGSTSRMVSHLVEALSLRGIPAEPLNLLETDLGALAVALVEPSTLVFASPVVLNGLHPLVQSAAYVIAALKPKTRFVSTMATYSWGGKIDEQVRALLSGLKVEFLAPVSCKGSPGADDLVAIDGLAQAISLQHPDAIP